MNDTLFQEHPEPFFERLARRLNEPLPGPMVGSRFAAQGRPGRAHDDPPADLSEANVREAAVLILLYPHEGRWHVPLTLRPDHLPDHPGQISLPGGALEPGETSDQAALREYAEELGGNPSDVRLLGRLSSVYVCVSRFLVYPWVGVCDHRPEMRPDPAEVEQLFEVPVSHLLDPCNLEEHEREESGCSYAAPHFTWQSHRIWGATCLMLGELVTLLGEPDGQEG